MKIKTSFIIIMCILFFSDSALSQELIVKKKNGYKQKVVPDGKRIAVRVNDDNTIRGNLIILDTNRILVDSDTVALSDINVLATNSLLLRTLGVPMISFGSFVTFTGTMLLVIGFSDPEFRGLTALGAIFIIPVIGISTTVAILGARFLFGGFYRAKKWDFTVSPVGP